MIHLQENDVWHVIIVTYISTAPSAPDCQHTPEHNLEPPVLTGEDRLKLREGYRRVRPRVTVIDGVSDERDYFCFVVDQDGVAVAEVVTVLVRYSQRSLSKVEVRESQDLKIGIGFKRSYTWTKHFSAATVAENVNLGDVGRTPNMHDLFRACWRTLPVREALRSVRIQRGQTFVIHTTTSL